MIVNNVVNVNHALRRGVEMFKEYAARPDCLVAPRGILTIEAPEPVTTCYVQPTQRVLFNSARDANPFFHFFEALWMLAGRNDLKFVAKINKQMNEYSDDGVTMWGAYGWRWRSFFGFDQIHEVVKLLKADSFSRRAVLQMWSPPGDLRSALIAGGSGARTGKDVPCNTAAFFKLRNGALHMTVTNRSNDMLWGAYGANVVHMSMLQEYVANKLGVGVGIYRQMSDSLHVYLDGKGGELWAKVREAPEDVMRVDPYRDGSVESFPMDASTDEWDKDLKLFLARATDDLKVEAKQYHTEFFQNVVVPMWRAWSTRSTSEMVLCAASDWRKAGLMWLNRRAK